MGRAEPGDSHPIINEWGGAWVVTSQARVVPGSGNGKCNIKSYMFTSPELSLILACLTSSSSLFMANWGKRKGCPKAIQRRRLTSVGEGNYELYCIFPLAYFFISKKMHPHGESQNNATWRDQSLSFLFICLSRIKYTFFFFWEFP
jgi:hypothetical protein